MFRKTMRFILLVYALVITLFVIGCGQSIGPHQCRTTTPYSSHPSVGLFVTDVGRCTTFLLRDNLVATAKHCLDNATEGSVWLGKRWHTVLTLTTHPGADVATMRLETVPDVPGVKLAADSVGSHSRAYGHGYGCNKQRLCTLHVGKGTRKGLIATHGCGCPGDSGGPLFDRWGYVIGILLGQDTAGYLLWTPVESLHEIL